MKEELPLASTTTSKVLRLLLLDALLTLSQLLSQWSSRIQCMIENEPGEELRIIRQRMAYE